MFNEVCATSFKIFTRASRFLGFRLQSIRIFQTYEKIDLILFKKKTVLEDVHNRQRTIMCRCYLNLIFYIGKEKEKERVGKKGGRERKERPRFIYYFFCAGEDLHNVQ